MRNSFETGNCGEDRDSSNDQKHRHVDDDQLYMAVVGTAESVFEFVKHLDELYALPRITNL